MLQNQLAYQTKQTERAWAKYHEELQSRHKSELDQYNLNLRIIECKIDIHLLNDVEQMNNQLKKNISCPLCMTIIEHNKLKISGSNTKYCERCFNQMTNALFCN